MKPILKEHTFNMTFTIETLDQETKMEPSQLIKDTLMIKSTIQKQEHSQPQWISVSSFMDTVNHTTKLHLIKNMKSLYRVQLLVRMKKEK